MDRTLRTFAIIAIVCVGGLIFLPQLLLRTDSAGINSPDGANQFLSELPALLVNLLGQTIFAFCLGVGVAALVLAFQRRQRWWVFGLLTLLLVATNGSYVILELEPLLENMQLTLIALLGSLFLEALVPLAVFIYSVSSLTRTTSATRSRLE